GQKRPAMGRGAANAADPVVLPSDTPRSEDPDEIAQAVLDGLRDGPASVVVELDRRIAIHDAVRAARAGDVVVIAGKGHETGQTIGERTIPFDDRVVAREELEALGGSGPGRMSWPRRPESPSGPPPPPPTRTPSTPGASRRADASSPCRATATATISSRTRGRAARQSSSSRALQSRSPRAARRSACPTR